jgi:hypothetical protein
MGESLADPRDTGGALVGSGVVNRLLAARDAEPGNR